MELADAKQALQDNLDAEPGLIDDVNAAQQTLQKCFDNINWLTAKIAELESPTPEPDTSVPVKDTFVQAIAMAKQAQAQPDIDKKVAG